LDPAIEKNEGHTVSLIGHFGGRSEKDWPKCIHVASENLKLFDIFNNKEIPAVGLALLRTDGARPWTQGETQYGESMEYTSSLVMLKAWVYKFSTIGEDMSAQNHCQVNFRTTTHVIKILFNGGFTRDGVHSLLPTDTSLFTINLKDGRILTSKEFIGLADLGFAGDETYKTNFQAYRQDGDNYLDLCLNFGFQDRSAEIESVEIQYGAVNPPRGNAGNLAHSVKVEAPGARVFPYHMAYKSVSAQMFWSYFWQYAGYAALGTVSLVGLTVLPIAGFMLSLVLAPLTALSS